MNENPTIVTDPNTLCLVSRRTNKEEVKDLEVVSKIRKALKTSWTEGCGLAAIQIGIPIRCAWYTHLGREEVLINPVILNEWGTFKKKEGCLSVPDKWFQVERAWTIEYVNKGKKKKVSGEVARIIQHEIDHMDGILLIEKGEEIK